MRLESVFLSKNKNKNKSTYLASQIIFSLPVRNTVSGREQLKVVIKTF